METILCTQGEIPLIDYHIRRLFWGICQNGFLVSEAQKSIIKEYILSFIPEDKKDYKLRFLFQINFENQFTYYSELIELKPSQTVFRLGVFREETKKRSFPWNAKTTERNLYKVATLWSKAHYFDEAVILNDAGHVVETSIFNLYIINDDVLYTPPLLDMPVKGVFRTWLSENSIFPIVEKSLTIEDLKNAEIILLTNAVRGICIGVLE
ncbi:MAG: aminotransferase class IV [Chitinophagales bacterium]|nr:aminotransferase class IV [Chitinophagales bacterium]